MNERCPLLILKAGANAGLFFATTGRAHITYSADWVYNLE